MTAKERSKSGRCESDVLSPHNRCPAPVIKRVPERAYSGFARRIAGGMTALFWSIKISTILRGRNRELGKENGTEVF